MEMKWILAALGALLDQQAQRVRAEGDCLDFASTSIKACKADGKSYDTHIPSGVNCKVECAEGYEYANDEADHNIQCDAGVIAPANYANMCKKIITDCKLALRNAKECVDSDGTALKPLGELAVGETCTVTCNDEYKVANFPSSTITCSNVGKLAPEGYEAICQPTKNVCVKPTYDDAAVTPANDVSSGVSDEDRHYTIKCTDNNNKEVSTLAVDDKGTTGGDGVNCTKDETDKPATVKPDFKKEKKICFDKCEVPSVAHTNAAKGCVKDGTKVTKLGRGESCTFTCEEKYIAEGDVELSCTVPDDDDQVRVVQPAQHVYNAVCLLEGNGCKEVSVKNGTVKPARKVSAEDKVEVTCEKGYVLSKSDDKDSDKLTLTCKETGKFDREAPTCKKTEFSSALSKKSALSVSLFTMGAFVSAVMLM